MIARFVALHVAADPIQSAKFGFLVVGKVFDEGNFAGGLDDLVVVANDFEMALVKVDAFIIEIQIGVLGTADQFIEILPRANGRQR